ncbi:MAG: hypothetical protein HYV97_07960 [Bdellovibrio sp.]|nr:hypothetical protein [Bdellovibrio sp.]
MSKIDNWDVKNAEEFARKWVNARCASLPRPSLTLPKLISVQGSEASMKQAIDNQLSRGRPAGISMCANIFTGPSSSNYSGVNERSSEHYYCNQQFCDCRPHAVVVVGRKMLNGKCHFIIRNSWGAECGGYSEAQRRAGQCDADRGEISVPADYLMRNTIDANYFE